MGEGVTTAGAGEGDVGAGGGDDVITEVAACRYNRIYSLISLAL